MIQTVLLAECIAKRYGRRFVLTAANLRVDAGCITVLVGRNGVGKSTLVRIAAGWIRPDQGTVQFRGRVQLGVRLHHLAEQGLFYLPDRDILSPGVSIGDHLDSVKLRWGRSDISEVVRLAGLEACLEQRPAKLSEGERRRAEFALAMLRHPDCLLADEPFRGLAPYDVEALAAVIRRMAENGCGIVVTGHEVPSLWSIADRVVWCADGTTYDLGNPANAAQDWRFRQGYLGPNLRPEPAMKTPPRP